MRTVPSAVEVAPQKKQRLRGAKAIVKKELIPFTRQISSMLGAGMTILASIQTLGEQCANPNFKAVLDKLKDSIENGEPMSRGLQAFPQVFDDMYVNMVIAGEQSGEFAGILRRLATILQSSARLSGKVKSAMTYPTVIICLALTIAAGLVQFVVPVFAEMFTSAGQKLPGLTQMLVDFADFVKAWWYVLLPSVVGVIWGFRAWIHTPVGRKKFDTFKLKMPVFGELNQKVSIARFCRLMAQMIASGVPILKSLDVVAGAMGNVVLQGSIQAARQEVEQGIQLYVALEGKPFIPILMLRMVAAGEKAGQLEEMLSSVADSYDEEVETLLGTLTSLMEPFLMVFLGGIIGTIVVAMFLPIFNMGSLAGA